MLTSISQQAAWALTAPDCECKREKVVYICLIKTCPAYNTHRLYCLQCNNDGIHEHFKHTSAIEFAKGSEKRWNAAKEVIEGTAAASK